MRTGCPTDKKQTTLEREFHKFLLYAVKNPNFDIYPVPPAFVRVPHKLDMPLKLIIKTKFMERSLCLFYIIAYILHYVEPRL